MYPYFANEYALLEHELGRTDFPRLHRYWLLDANPMDTSPMPVYSEKPSRSVSAKSSRSSIKADTKPKRQEDAPARANERDSTLNCLAHLFQGMYSLTLCRLMLE
ncbi:hypothetical protein C8R46DRAFT_1213416 [Mycena filopes]|nr:hypothetical protein C8R46DRAFT_1213416 [Mycena filopes]